MEKLFIVATLITRSVIRFQTATAQQLNPINLVQAAVTYADYNFGQFRDLERRIINSSHVLKPSRPEAKLYLTLRTSPELLETGFDALTAVEASVYLSGRSEVGCANLDDEGCGVLVSQYSLDHTTLAPLCREQMRSTYNCTAKYRSIDGSCNNIARGVLGKAGTVYDRYLLPEYFLGISDMAAEDRKFGRAVANPRAISNKISTACTFIEENDITLAFAVFAQFIANDLALTPITEYITQDVQITCCEDNGQRLWPRHIHPYCAAIDVPQNDSVYDHNSIRCLSYVRSLPGFKPNCTFGNLEQMNHATHLLDGSMIYGTNEKQASGLRAHKSGTLRTRKIGPFSYLPLMYGNYSNECPGICVESGDNRVNEHPQLTALHTIFVREHNRIARCLARAYPDYTDEILYQEARRLVIAEIQHITYNEFLPLLLGDEFWAQLDKVGYDPNVLPVVYNEVANAVLKFPLSMLQQNISLMNERREEERLMTLSKSFFHPHMLNDLLKELVRGMTTQPSQKLDAILVPDLTSKYYSSDGRLGLDALSFAIQQGRDHGFPSYLKYRQACQLSAVMEFDDLSNIPRELREKLKAVHPNVDSIDLIIGGLAENRVHGIVGQTFACLLLDQFRRTRAADRFFYLNNDQPRPFKGEELRRIKGVTLAAVICRNSGIESLQPNVFLQLGPNNFLVSCIDLGEWTEGICI